MIFSAEQVADTQGPDTPGCDCPGCQSLVALKALICAPVTAHEIEAFAQRGAGEKPSSAWLSVLMIAAARAAAQGFSPDTLEGVVNHAIEQTHLLNPHLHYTANSQDMPL
jgi:hypothetical protein